MDPRAPRWGGRPPVGELPLLDANDFGKVAGYLAQVLPNWPNVALGVAPELADLREIGTWPMSSGCRTGSCGPIRLGVGPTPSAARITDQAADRHPDDQLGVALRRVREGRGVSLRRLGEKALPIHSALVEYERGHRLASLDVIEAYEAELGDRLREAGRPPSAARALRGGPVTPPDLRPQTREGDDERGRRGPPSGISSSCSPRHELTPLNHLRGVAAIPGALTLPPGAPGIARLAHTIGGSSAARPTSWARSASSSP
jgi:hypothetical protein